MYKLNPAAYGSVFVLPEAVVENCIYLASELQLKALLLVAGNGTTDKSAEGIASLLKKNADDVRDALDFWVGEGILVSDGVEPKPVREPEKPQATEKKSEKEFASMPMIKPTMEQFNARIAEDEEFRYLCNAAQEILSRTIGTDGQMRLLMAHDYYGLPVDVILTMLSYLKNAGKTSSAEIAKCAKLWAEKDIVTHEAANAFIDKMNNANAVFDEIKKRFGLGHERPSAKQAQFISDWLSLGFSTDMILKAYDEMVDHTEKPTFGYVNKILLGWHEKGYKTTDDVESGAKAESKSSKKKMKNNEAVSFDIEKAEKKAKNGPINISKRES